MIDFENTGSRGLQGAEYLQAEDLVTIFYSQACMKIEQGRLRQLKEAGCSFKLCKLQKSGKNALDFYIASYIGEIYGQGYTGITAIVSNDAGFQAVKEYWKSCASVLEQQRIRKALEDSFVNTDYEGLVEQIMEVVARPKPLKLLYLDSVKQFGKKDELSIYQKVKQLI